MLKTTNLFGKTEDKIKKAIERIKHFEPEEGYYLAFSGGKDSQATYHLAEEAEVKFDAHYNLTTVDPPELVYFIRDIYPDVIIDKPSISMWKLIEKNLGPPNFVQRYCCRELKERGGEERLCITGVRWAESTKRKMNRNALEVIARKKTDSALFNDNEESRRLFENCQIKGKRIVNPIIDWSDNDVWEYIRSRGLKYCSLYDEGWKRLGCVGCPLPGAKCMIRDFERWPKYKDSYLRCFERVIKMRKEKGKKCTWNNAEEMMDWWIYGNQEKAAEGQLTIYE